MILLAMYNIHYFQYVFDIYEVTLIMLQCMWVVLPTYKGEFTVYFGCTFMGLSVEYQIGYVVAPRCNGG